MLTIHCTAEAIELNDMDGAMRRAGVDFSALPLTSSWQHVTAQRQARLVGGCLEVAERSPTLYPISGAREIRYPLRNPAAPKSHEQLLRSLLNG